jgi:hypothetical protein
LPWKSRRRFSPRSIIRSQATATKRENFLIFRHSGSYFRFIVYFSGKKDYYYVGGIAVRFIKKDCL